MLMYHHGRLIKAFLRVGIQLRANDEGMGVVGIVTADFLTPTHNKQDFADNKLYQMLINNLEIKLKDYWQEKNSIDRRFGPYFSSRLLICPLTTFCLSAGFCQ